MPVQNMITPFPSHLSPQSHTLHASDPAHEYTTSLSHEYPRPLPWGGIFKICLVSLVGCL